MEMSRFTSPAIRVTSHSQMAGAAGTGFGAECFPCVLMLFLEAGRLRLTSSLMKVLDGA